MTNKTQTSIREQLFNQTTPGKRVKKTLSSGIEVELRQPARGVVNKIMEESYEVDGKGNPFFKPMTFIDKCAIKCTYNPQTGNRVFSDNDYEKIEQFENTDWFDELVSMVQEIVNVNKKDMKKN